MIFGFSLGVQMAEKVDPRTGGSVTVVVVVLINDYKISLITLVRICATIEKFRCIRILTWL